MPAFCSINQLHGLQSTTKIAEAKTYRAGLSPDDGDDVNHACTQTRKGHTNSFEGQRHISGRTTPTAADWRVNVPVLHLPPARDRTIARTFAARPSPSHSQQQKPKSSKTGQQKKSFKTEKTLFFLECFPFTTPRICQCTSCALQALPFRVSANR